MDLWHVAYGPLPLHLSQTSKQRSPMNARAAEQVIMPRGRRSKQGTVVTGDWKTMENPWENHEKTYLKLVKNFKKWWSSSGMKVNHQLYSIFDESVFQTQTLSKPDDPRSTQDSSEHNGKKQGLKHWSCVSQWVLNHWFMVNDFEPYPAFNMSNMIFSIPCNGQILNIRLAVFLAKISGPCSIGDWNPEFWLVHGQSSWFSVSPYQPTL